MMKLKHYIEKLQKLNPEQEVIDDLWTEKDINEIADDVFGITNLEAETITHIIDRVEIVYDADCTMRDMIIEAIELFIEPQESLE